MHQILILTYRTQRVSEIIHSWRFCLTPVFKTLWAMTSPTVSSRRLSFPHGSFGMKITSKNGLASTSKQSGNKPTSGGTEAWDQKYFWTTQNEWWGSRLNLRVKNWKRCWLGMSIQIVVYYYYQMMVFRYFIDLTTYLWTDVLQRNVTWVGLCFIDIYLAPQHDQSAVQTLTNY